MERAALCWLGPALLAPQSRSAGQPPASRLLHGRFDDRATQLCSQSRGGGRRAQRLCAEEHRAAVARAIAAHPPLTRPRLLSAVTQVKRRVRRLTLPSTAGESARRTDPASTSTPPGRGFAPRDAHVSTQAEQGPQRYFERGLGRVLDVAAHRQIRPDVRAPLANSAPGGSRGVVLELCHRSSDSASASRCAMDLLSYASVRRERGVDPRRSRPRTRLSCGREGCRDLRINGSDSRSKRGRQSAGASTPAFAPARRGRTELRRRPARTSGPSRDYGVVGVADAWQCGHDQRRDAAGANRRTVRQISARRAAPSSSSPRRGSQHRVVSTPAIASICFSPPRAAGAVASSEVAGRSRGRAERPSRRPSAPARAHMTIVLAHREVGKSATFRTYPTPSRACSGFAPSSAGPARRRCRRWRGRSRARADIVVLPMPFLPSRPSERPPALQGTRA